VNSMDWLNSLKENAQKGLIPPVPPEAAPAENAAKALIPPVAPCSSLCLIEMKNISEEGKRKETYWGEESEPETSGGDRGNQGFHRGNGCLDDRWHRGNPGKAQNPEIAPAPKQPRKPFLTAGGDLSIPFDSDPKYHWWKPGGQSVKETMAELLAKVEQAQRVPPSAAAAKLSNSGEAQPANEATLATEPGMESRVV
jgi:hypothetical protein